MENIKIKNKKYNKELSYLSERYLHLLADKVKNITKLVILKYKKYSSDEYYVLFCFKYALLYTGVLDLDDPIVSLKDKRNFLEIKKLLDCELKGDLDCFVNMILNFDEDLFLIKVIIKYFVLKYDSHFMEFIPGDHNKYYEATGWMIPILSYKGYDSILSVYEDKYFEKVYREEYGITLQMCMSELAEFEKLENSIINMYNDFSDILSYMHIFAIVRIRRKTAFSIYNKVLRKKGDKLFDIVGSRIIFENKEDIYKFSKRFEENFVIKKKKDYIKSKKDNGYESLHYVFLYPHYSTHIEVELQLRTKSMEDKINDSMGLNHFTYSIKKHKWSSVFKELNNSVKILSNKLKKGGEI